MRLTLNTLNILIWGFVTRLMAVAFLVLVLMLVYPLVFGGFDYFDVVLTSFIFFGVLGAAAGAYAQLQE